MSKHGVSGGTPKAPIMKIGANVKEIKVETMKITTERVSMFEMETRIMTTTSTGVTMVTETIRVGPMFHLKIGKFLLGMVEVAWCESRISCR